MRIKQFILIGLLAMAGECAVAQVNMGQLKKAVSGVSRGNLTSEEVGAGLKEALTKGVVNGTDLVSQLDGYYKNPAIMIPFPQDVKRVEDRLRQVGMGAEVDKFVMALNRAAEDAATEAKPIFVSAIRQMTIQDAFAILNGQQDAATQYLSRTTSDQLMEKFRPIVQASLSKVNATQYYTSLITSYNKIPLTQKVNPDLEAYATQKAIEGLFVMVAKEEMNIRKNPGARTSELMQKVFAAQK